MLPIAVQGLRSRPTACIDVQHAVRFPKDAVGNQDFAGLVGIAGRPQHQDAHRMIQVRETDRFGTLPLGVVCDRKLRS